MHTIKQIGAICMLLLFYAANVMAQHPTPGQPVSQMNLTDVLPPAPNAFELTRYSGLPVNESTGSVSVTIPMGNLKAGSVSVPINLTYNSGNGILVNQAASRTGMSWVLNAGGVISRTVYNNPDEANMWLTPPSMTGPAQAVYDYLFSAGETATGFDTQVDIFSFNFNGYNGQFYLNPADKSKVVMIDASNLKVEPNFDGHDAGDWDFKITDPKGVKYYFGGTTATEKTKTDGTGSGCTRNFLSAAASAWYLIKIEHYAGETITFTYDAETYDYFSDVSETIFAGPASPLTPCPNQNCPAPPASTICLSHLQTTGVKLIAITTPFEGVAIGYTSRQDIPTDVLVSQVSFYKRSPADGLGSLYQTYGLQYATASNSLYHNPYIDNSELSYRPFLIGVVRQGPGIQTEVHSMDYYNMSSLPSRLAFAQDYWGYFNGANNQHLVPPSGDPDIDPLFPTGLANREPNASFSFMGLLKSITYPTKGTDVITYEPNTIYSGVANRQAAGVRVYQDATKPVTGNQLTKTYIYAALASQSRSSGVIRFDASPMDYYSIFQSGMVCGDPSGGQIGVCNYHVAYSRPLHQLSYYQGANIYYSNVIELRDETWANGGIEHQYAPADRGEDATVYGTAIIPGTPISNAENPPILPGGMETLRQTFVTTGQSGGSYLYTIVNSVATSYVIDSRLSQSQVNYVVRKNWQPFVLGPSPGTFAAYDWSGYNVVTRWVYPSTVTTTSFDLNGANPVATTTNYVYGNTNNLLLTETSMTGSDNIIQTTDYKYPNDFAGTAPYDAMVAANDIDHVIEQLNYKGGALTAGIKTDYLQFGTGPIVYKPSVINAKTTTGSYEPRINFAGYNGSGGLLTQSKTNGPLSSYIWGYNNLLPVAQAKNADATEIFYEGFEFTTATGVTTTAHTGKQAWNGSYTVPFTLPDGKSYVISWFQQNGSKWDYHKEAYTGSKIFSGVVIDDVAVYPADAQMSMIAYDPVAGPTGMIDAKGETTIYIYDTFNRLTDIKDKDGNIVKHYDYHYSTGSL